MKVSPQVLPVVLAPDERIDAATDDRASGVFEVWGDGKKLWNSALVSGFDPVRDAAVDIAGVKRLRRVVTDAGDGNRFDAADWAEAVLERVGLGGLKMKR